MSLFEELIEDKNEDKKIVKSLKPKKELSPDIFNKKGSYYVMKNDIRKKLIEIANDFIESIGVEFFIHDIVLTGSLANFNWSKYSDIDLHILLDMDEFGTENKNEILLRTIFKEFFDAKKNIWNTKHNIKVKNYDVEVYAQDISEAHVSSGVYSIMHNNWIIEPKMDSPKIDDRKIIEKGGEVAKKIQEITKIKDEQKALKAVDEYKTKLKKFRKCGLEHGGEYSYENLTFKLLRRNGEIKKLLDFKHSLKTNKLSLTEDPDITVDGQEFDDKDAITFGYINGQMVLGFNKQLFPKDVLMELRQKFPVSGLRFYYRYAHLLLDKDATHHGDSIVFYEMLRKAGIEDEDLGIKEKFDNGELFNRNTYTFPGRLWYKSKVISFWKYPVKNETMVKLLDDINKQMQKIYHTTLDFSQFKIEVIKNGQDYLVPIPKYFGSDDVSKEKFEQPHLLSPEEKSKHPQMISVKNKNMERNAEIEKKWDSLAKRNFILKKDINEMFLLESPDKIEEPYSGEVIARFQDDDAISFAEYNGEMIIGFNYSWFPEDLYKKLYDEFEMEYYDDIATKYRNEVLGLYPNNILNKFEPSAHFENFAFYEMLRKIGVEDTDLGLIDIYNDNGKLSREDIEFGGRLWYDKKIISFWQYPKDYSELKNILGKINQKLHKIYHKTIDFNTYTIEIINDEGHYELNPMPTYIKSLNASEEEMRKAHTMDSEEKSKTQQMQDVKNSNIKRDAEIEDKWGTLANKNFILKKDIAEIVRKK